MTVKFTYKARSPEGKMVNGLIEADSEMQAASRLEQMSLIPLEITASSGMASVEHFWNQQMVRVSHQEVLVFTRQLSTMIGSGVSLIQSLESVSKQTNNKRFKVVLNDMMDSLKNGISLSQTLAKYPSIFPNIYVSLVRVGESGGLLDKVLKRLADLSTQDIEMRSRLRAALVYPTVLAVVAFLIVNFVLIAVLPRFVSIFDASSSALPLPTKILLGVSNVVSNYWWLLALGTFAVVGLFYRFYRSPQGRYTIDYALLKFPLFGPLSLKVMICRIARSIAALTRSGVPVLEALRVVESTVSNVVIQQILYNVREAISKGQSLTEPFAASGFFPPMVLQLISTGERTGKLGEMFDEIANFYEPEVEYTVRNMTSLLEPIMLLAMGLVVAFIALSVLLPIFNLISVIRR